MSIAVIVLSIWSNLGPLCIVLYYRLQCSHYPWQFLASNLRVQPALPFSPAHADRPARNLTSSRPFGEHQRATPDGVRCLGSPGRLFFSLHFFRTHVLIITSPTSRLPLVLFLQVRPETSSGADLAGKPARLNALAHCTGTSCSHRRGKL